MQPTDNVGTFTLTAGTITINEDNGIRVISMELLAGVVTYVGSLPIAGNNPTPLTLVADKPVVVGFDFSIDGFTIDATGGSVKLIYGR